MAEDFDFNNLGTQPKPKPVLNSQNLYDALKSKNFPSGKEEISIGGQTISTPKDLETFLTNDKNQQKFYEAFQSNPKFKSFGIKDASQFKSAMAKPTGFAWMPTPAKPESTVGVPEFDPQEVKSRVDSGFAKIAARGLNVTPSGVELTTPEQFKEFTMLGAEEYEQWKRQNEGKLAQSGINPYAWDRDLTEYIPSSEETFQKQTEEEAQRLLTDKNAQAVNTIITELGIKPEAIGEIADEQFKDPNYSYKVKTEAFGFESEADVKIENIFTTLTQLGYGEEEAYDFINNQRDAYRQRKFKQLNYEKNQQAVKTQSESTQLKGINVYQLDMDQKGFNMLNDKQKAVANEYSKLDELNLQLRRIQNRKGNAFEAQPEVEKLNSEIKATQERIKTLQVEADGAPVTLYDPIQRLPVAPEIAAQSIAKANQKYNESYYQNNLLGNIKQDRDTLLLETEELRETIVAQSKKIEEATSRGIQVSPREQISLSANTKLYNDKVAELYVLNKGIYTNSNPLKRENANFAGGVEQFVKQSTFGGLSKNTQGLMSSEEAQIMASKLTSYGLNVSAKDLEAGKMGAFESFGYSFLPMLGTMVEMAAYQAMGNVASEAVAGTRLVSVAREFLKNTYGTNSLRVKAFDIFLKESLTAATQIGSYVAADQSAAGAVGEIYSERAFEKLTAKKQLEKLAKGGKGRILYVAGKFLSGAGGETLSETAGTIADEFANNGYNLRAAFDLATEEGQLGTVALASLVLTSPGDIGLLIKTQSKFNEYLVKKAGVDVDPAIIEMKREIDAAIDNYNNRPTSTKAPEPVPVMDAMVEAQPVPMGEGPIQAPEEVGASEQEVPQEKVEQVRQEEKLEVEKRVANLGEEFHVVEKDGEVEKQVTYRYDPETGKLQSKGYTDFNNSYSDVNEDLKAQVEQKMKDNGMLSASKALEIAKKNLNIDENSKLIWKDGKLLYSRDEVNRVIEQGAEGTRNTAKSTFEKVKQKRAKVDETVFENTEKVNTDDSGFNVMVGAIRRAFGGKLRLDYGSFFFNGAKINTDGQRGIPRLSNYMAPIIESFTKIGNGASRVNTVVANIINSKYFNESFTPEDMVALQQGGLVNDAAMNLLSNLLINEDAVLSEVFDEDPTMIRDFKALREQLNTYASKEFVGSESKNFSYAFYNTRISESRSNLTEAELAKTGREFGLAQEEKRQIQNIAMSARGEEYTPEEVASIRYSEGKIGAQEFLDIVKEDTTGLTEEEIKTKADAKSKVLNVAQDFETYKSRKESLGKSRKARIAKIKKMALDNVFDFKVFGVNPQTVLGKAIGPIAKGRKLRKQKDYAARIMNTQLEFLAMRAGFDDAQLEEFIDTMLTFEKIDEQAMIQVASNIASSQSGRVAFSREMSNDPSFQSDKGFGRKYLAKFDEDNEVDPVLSYFLRGWYKSTTGMWMYEQGHPDKIMTKEGVRPSDGQIMNLKDVIDSDKFFEFFPGLQNLNVKFEIGKGDRNFTEMQGDTLRVVLPSNYSNEMLLATVMSEVRDIAAREVGLPSQPIVKTSQEIFDDFLNTPIYKDSARADKLRNAISKFQELSKDSEEVSTATIENLIDPNYSTTPEADAFKKELLADPEMKAMLTDMATKYIQYSTKNRVFGSDVAFRAEPISSSISNDYQTIANKSGSAELIAKVEAANAKYKSDLIGLLQETVNRSNTTAVQKANIQKFIDVLKTELLPGGETLSDLGLQELINGISDGGLRVILSEVQDMEYNNSAEMRTLFATSGLENTLSAENNNGENAISNAMKSVKGQEVDSNIKPADLSKLPEEVDVEIKKQKEEIINAIEETDGTAKTIGQKLNQVKNRLVEKISTALSEKIQKRLEELYPEIELKFITDGDAIGWATSSDNVFNQLSNKKKEEYKKSLEKKRPELVERGLVDSVLADIEKFGEENSADGKGNPKLEKLAAYWISEGHIILPEDGYKIIEANRIATLKKIDPFSYKNPLEIIDKFAGEVKEKPIDPDTISEFSNKRTLPDGVTIYNVDDTKEGQASVRRIIDTHFGKDSNPWCLAARIDDKLDQAWGYWNDTYNKVPKQIAFQNGKLIAFCASNKEYNQWWNKLDRPSDGIPISKSVGEGKKQDIVMSEEGEIVKKGDITRNTKKDGKIIKKEKWSPNGIPQTEENFNEKGELSGPNRMYYPDGKLAVESNYLDGKLHGKYKKYSIGGKVKREIDYKFGKKDGFDKMYNEENILVSEHSYKEDFAEGPFRKYYDSGKLKDVGTYSTGELSGVRKTYHDNGKLEGEYNYNNNKLDGQVKEFYYDGKIKRLENYKNGIIDGPYKIYHRNGNLAEEGQFENGLKKGIIKEYKEDGTLLDAVIAERGKISEVARKIVGQADIEKMTVLIDSIDQNPDTLPHEYAHHYIAWFRESPIVQEAMAKFGGEEELVQAIGEAVVNKQGEVWDWWKRFTQWVKSFYTSLDDQTKSELVDILSNSFLTAKDLETGKKGISRERSKELAAKATVGNKTLFSRDSVIRAAINLKEDGSAIIYAVTDPNVSSPIHEMAHLLENYLTDSEKQAVMDFAGESEWNTNTSEAFARGFERFLYEGESPNKQMSLVFEKFKQWLTEIYNALGLANLGKELNPQMTSIYKTIFGEGASQEEVIQQDEDQEIYDLIEAQRANKVNDESIYMGLLRAGYAPQDLTEFFNARTKQTVAKALEQEGSSATKDMARAVYMDSVTIRRTSEEIVAMLQEMDPVEREMMRNTLLSDIQNSDITLFDLIATLQEKVARGEDATKEFNDITSIGTHAGRLLQRMKELKQNTGENTLAQLIKQFDSRGRKLPDNVKKKLEGLAKEMDEAKKIYEQAKLDAQNFPTQLSKKDPSKTNYQYYFDAQNNYKNARFDFFKNLKPYARTESMSELYDTLVRGNLLTIGSFAINLTSNAVKSIINIPVNFVSGGISLARNTIFRNTKQKGAFGKLTTSRGFGYYKTIAKSLGKATIEAVSAIKNGSVVEDANGLQISRGFNGIRAARDTFGMLMDFILNRDMTQEELAEKYNFPLTGDNKIGTKDKLLRAMEGTFGLVAELNFRALGGPDAFFKTAAYYGALFEQAKIMGLSNVPEEKYGGVSELQFFIDMNSDYSNTEAMEEAAKLIYANSGALYKVFSRLVGSGGKINSTSSFPAKAGKSAFTTLIPYQKIPTNVAEEFIQFSSPTYSIAASGYFYSSARSLDEKIKSTRIPSVKKKLIQEQRALLRNADVSLSRAVVGYALQTLAYEIIMNFAISGSASPMAGVDEKERQWKKEFMPADSINLTLLFENLFKDNKRNKWKKGDKIVSLRTLGVFGAILSTNKTQLEKENRENQVINISDINLNIGKRPNPFMNVGGIFPYLLDQTMVKNLGDFFEALSDEGSLANFLSSYFNTVVTAFAPNHLNTFTKFGREFETSYKASPEEKESESVPVLTLTLLENKLKEKIPYLFDDNYRVQYDILGKPRRQTGNDLDPIGNLFGITPLRRKPGLDPDSYIFEHQKNIQEKVSTSEKELTWNDIVFQVFSAQQIKDVIPSDVPKTIKVGEGIVASLSTEEQNMFREERNKKRDEVVKYIISQANGEFKKMIDPDSDYNKRADGTPILYKDGKLLGYSLISSIMKDTYSSIDGLINQTLAPVIMRKKYDQLTPEEKKYIDQVNKNNVLGELFNQLVNNNDVQEALKKAGKDLDTVFGNLRGQAEQYQPQGFDEGPGIEGEGGIDSGPSIDDGEGI